MKEDKKGSNEREYTPFNAVLIGGDFPIGFGEFIEEIVKLDLVMMSVVMFVQDYDNSKDIEGKKPSLEDAIKAIRDEFSVEELEEGLRYSFNEYKNCNSENCKGGYFIERFIDLLGIDSFSEPFVSYWQSTRPITFTVGQNTFTINGNEPMSIDNLIESMDKIDYSKDNFENIFCLIDKADLNMSLLKPALTEWSSTVMALEKLISFSAECADKNCDGCMFIKEKLIERLGLDNLPEGTQTLYKKVFLSN